jgi:hypothetical protein
MYVTYGEAAIMLVADGSLFARPLTGIITAEMTAGNLRRSGVMRPADISAPGNSRRPADSGKIINGAALAV